MRRTIVSKIIIDQSAKGIVVFGMNTRLSSWLKKEIRVLPPRSRKPRSPLDRLIQRILLILSIVAVSVFAIWRAVLWRDVHRHFVHFKMAGWPISGAELNNWAPRIPDEQNGAIILQEAFALLRSAPRDRAKLLLDSKVLARTNPWNLSTEGMVSEYLETNDLAIEKLNDGLRFARYRYPVDFSYGPDTQLPHLAKLKDLARLVGMKAVLETQHGSNAWSDDVLLQLKLAGTLDVEPIAISYLVRNSIIHMATQVVERNLNRTAPNAPACISLQNAFQSIIETNLLPAALLGEAATAIPIFRLSWKEIQSFKTDDEYQPRKPQQYSGKGTGFLWTTGFFERDLNFYLETMERAVEMSSAPFPARSSLTNYFENASMLARKHHYLLCSMVLPSLSRIVVRDATIQAQVELAATALAVERFRKDRGQLPGRLAELTPVFLEHIPIDPFNGTPLHYRLLEKGYVLYSVDTDGHDDGGREPPDRRKPGDHTSYDIAFIVER